MAFDPRLLNIASDRADQNAMRALIHERVRRAAAEALAEFRARQQRERKRHGKETKAAKAEQGNRGAIRENSVAGVPEAAA